MRTFLNGPRTARASPTPRPSTYQRLTPRRKNAERRRRVLQVRRAQSGEDDLRTSSQLVLYLIPSSRTCFLYINQAFFSDMVRIRHVKMIEPQRE